ncbi:Copper resistance protein CopC [Aquisphaera giovannonii]|uniref:Copper resistance protein CopC n=1 Tax=Aquisphaera giovannonii TaxID=406548 RepID=A0A5B9WBG5_9BACT|nr:Ig-like domain repeat protein [Aquisphaera giovannonii]QEH37847.1 Copper resistance protein CopC [Aquisphaera giovannonii]
MEILEGRPLLSTNPIVAENLLQGTPSSQWSVAGAGDSSIQGFTTAISVDQGETVYFKVNDPSGASYHLEIYRMGYYQGNGARLVATVPSSAVLKQVQPAPLTDYATGLVDAGNWSVSASWSVPADATSGIYFADVRRDDTGGASQIFFVVRDDASTSDILFQTSDSTWEAYNAWDGTNSATGKSLYVYDGDNPDLQYRQHALAVSYNRPLTVSAVPGGLGDYNSPLHAEYPMVRWLEANGYDVSYTTDLDTATRGNLILNHKVFMSVGHDEYWSAEQRDSVEAARDAGVNLAFFSGNEVFWKTRWAPSISPDATPNRTVVTYKESQVNQAIDPMDQSPTWIATPTWRDIRFGDPADAGKPENALSGTIYMNDRTNVDLGISLNVPATDADLRFWRNTSVADLQAGQVATLGQYIVGYEVDEDLDNGFRPAGLIDMSSTTFSTTSHVIVQSGAVVGPGTGTHSITLYRAASGALVFGAGTIQWSWGLDGNNNIGTVAPSLDIQQATVNLLADMYSQPYTLQAGLLRASASTDVSAPTSIITAPLQNSSVTVGSTITVSGTAADSGGGVVGGVEVSTDGGLTWHPATGRENWSYTFTVTQPGPIVIKSRAVDDSANLEIPSAGVIIKGVLQPTSTTDLVAEYTFDEGTGSTIHDLSGKGNNGTASNTTWTTGLFGSALSFDGADSWVTINSSSSLNLTSGMTLEAWVKPAAASSNNQTILLKEQSGNLAYSLYATNQSGSPSAHAYVNGADRESAGSAGLPVNAWSFLTATFDGSDLLLYVNGNLVSDQAVSGPIVTSTGALRIGGNSVWGEYFQGLIDQVRIYSRPLNAGEILSDMSTPIGGTAETTPPTGALTGPSDGSTVSGVTTLNVTAADNVRVAGVQFLLNGSYLGSLVATAPYTLAWDTRKVPNGTYVISAIVEDSAGNSTRLGNVSVTVSNAADTTPPTVSITTPYGGLVSGAIVTNAVAADNMGLAGVQFQLDGVNIGPFVTSAPYRLAWNTSGVQDGTHTLTAVARDLAGNATTSAPISISIDKTPPTVTTYAPAGGGTNVPTSGSSISVTFSEPILSGTAQFLLRSPDGLYATGHVTSDASGRIVSFIPDGALEPSTTYTLTVANAIDPAGNAMSPVSWAFTTTSTVVNASLWGSATLPAVTWFSDPTAYELGVKFTSDIAGWVTGLRFYKGSSAYSNHVGHLWDASGNLLATLTFTGETGSGWQQAIFSQPVEIAAGAIYVASYYAPSGGYALSSGYFATSPTNTGVLHAVSSPASGGNGVYRVGSSGFPTATTNASNYWVDVIFANILVPAVKATTPTDQSTGVSGLDPQISITFSKAVQPGSISATLTDPAGHAVPSTITYDSSTGIATLTASAALLTLTTYTVTVTGALDTSGNAMAAPYSWSFTTAPVDTTPPTVLTRTPGPNATNISNVSPADAVLVVFNEAVQLGTVSFVLTDPSGNEIPTTMTYESSSHTVALTSDQSLAMGTTYTVALSGAQDLSGNVMAPLTWSFTTGRVVDESLFGTSATPAVVTTDDTSALELGVRFSSDVGGYVTGVRFYKGPLNIGTHVAHIWLANDTLQFGPCPGCCGAACFLKLAGGSLLASATFTNETASGWQEVTFANPVFIMPHVTYIVSYSDPSGRFSYNDNYFATSGVDSGVLHVPSSLAGGNSVFGSLGSFPTSTYNSRNYWVDPVFNNTLDDRTPPTVSSTTPGPGATDVAATSTISATFSEVVNTGTGLFTLVDSAGHSVPVSASWQSAVDSQSGNSLVLTPQSPLNPLTTYTVRIGGVADVAGNVMSAPISWSFKTARNTATMGVTIWPETASPAVATAADGASIVVGVKFSSDVAGLVSGVRFYKGAGNAGTHVGYLWTASGALLGTVTFAGETAGGWQEADFAQPVAIAANTTYVVGYLAPSGGYSYTGGYFAGGAFDSGPLHAPGSGASGGNGVYTYQVGGFPTSSYNDANYWVDVAFLPSSGQSATATAVSSSAGPSSYGSSVTFTATVTSAGGVPTGTVTFADGETVLGTASLDATGTARFTTSALAAGGHAITASYGGNSSFIASASAPVGQLVRATIWPVTASPAVGSVSESAPVVLGVKFTSDVAGLVAGVRFYKGPGNAGAHVGYLWTASGVLLGTVTFAGETAGGWQEADFAQPVAIAAGATYVVGYLAPSGGYSYTGGYFAGGAFDSGPLHALGSGASGGNGVYTYQVGGFPTSSYNDANYWVDVAFLPSSGQSATATALSSSAGPSSYGSAVTFTATVSSPFGVPGGTVIFLDGATTLGTATLDSTGTATFTTASLAAGGHSITAEYVGDATYQASASAALQQAIVAATTTGLTSSANPSIYGSSVTFTATVTSAGGVPTGMVTFADGATVLGTASLDGTGTARFTTSALAAAGHSITASYGGATSFTASASAAFGQLVRAAIWPESAAPAVGSVSESAPVVLGVKFTSDVAGLVAGVRFYKGPGNAGAHVGYLWTASGVLLGTVTFAGETAGGWQEADFAQPVAIAAGATYVVGYLAPSGGYSYTGGYFAGGAFDSGPLHALGSGASGGNGVYTYQVGGFPTSSYNDANYWVDVAFLPSSGQSATATAVSSSAGPSSYGSAVTFTATVSSPDGTPTGSVFFLDGAAVLGVAPVDGSGTATFTTASLAAGGHAITAEYVGDGTYQASASAALTQTVNAGATSTTLASSAAPSIYGSSVTFTATVQSAGGVPTGTVTFADGATVLGTAALDGTGTARFTTSALAAGGHSITAEYLGDGTYQPSVSAALSQSVSAAATTTAVASSLSPSAYGSSVTFTATVSSGAGIPGGTVTFADGSTTLGTASLDGSGVATLTTSVLAAGSHTITASYGGAGNFAGSASAALSQTVNAAATTTAVASSLSPSAYGSSVTFTATVSSGAGVPGGTVTFADGATTLGTAALDGTGTATLTIAALGAGSHSITASYGGAGNFAGSASAALSQTVNAAATTTAVASSLSPSAYGSSVTFTATVSSGAGIPGGTVTFADGATVLGTAALDGSGVATLTTSVLAAGSHTITASYGGAGNFAGSASAALSQTVNAATTVTAVVSSLSPSAYGSSVTFTATVSSGAGIPGGTVTFADGATVLGTAALDGSGVATLTTSVLAAGGHSITASYGGAANFAASASAALSQTVNAAATTTTVVSSLRPSAYGSSVTFTATVSSAGGTPGGTVTFKDGATTLGTATLSGTGVATLTTSALAAGSHTITASYGGAGNFAASASAALSQTVNAAATSTAVVSSLNPSTSGTSVTFTATVTSAGGVPGGTVTFKDGSTTLGTATLSGSGVATFATSSLALGSHTITATFGGSTNFAASTSPSLSQAVVRSTSTTLSSSSNPSTFGATVTFTANVSASVGTPTGTVTFTDGATILGTATLSFLGRATFTTSALAAGSHTITASYGGSSSYAASASPTLSQSVNPAATTTALSSSTNPSAYGGSVTFTARVTSSGGVPTGTVTFKDGTAVLGTATLSGTGVATFTTSVLSLGIHPITAAFGGSTNFATSTSSTLSQTVSRASTSTTVTSSSNPSSYGTSVTFTATVTTSGGVPTGTVTFSDGATTLGTATLSGTGVATFTTSTLTSTTHSITASYASTANFNGSTSSSLTQTVNRASTTTAVTSSLNPSPRFTAVTFTATVTATGGAPIGTVTFKDGSTTLGTASLVGAGVATFTTSSLSVGSHFITATYSGGVNFNASTSGSLTQRVNNPLYVAGGPDPSPVVATPLTQNQLSPIVAEAVKRWQEGGYGANAIAALSGIRFEIADLPGGALGMSGPGVISIDANAAGYGWFVDPTPGDDLEFAPGASGPARTHVDLLSVVSHEMGHELGLDHDAGDDVMAAALPVGERRTPYPGAPAPAPGLRVAYGSPDASSSPNPQAFDVALEQVAVAGMRSSQGREQAAGWVGDTPGSRIGQLMHAKLVPAVPANSTAAPVLSLPGARAAGRSRFPSARWNALESREDLRVSSSLRGERGPGLEE